MNESHTRVRIVPIDLGRCCGCGGRRGVINFFTLDVKAPVAGTGWGCRACGLADDGAVAVMCDDCLANGRPILFVCVGWPHADERMPYEQAGGRHLHDPLRHPSMLAPDPIPITPEERAGMYALALGTPPLVRGWDVYPVYVIAQTRLGDHETLARLVVRARPLQRRAAFN